MLLVPGLCSPSHRSLAIHLSGYEAVAGGLSSAVTQELEDEEQTQKRKMADATDMLVAEYKKQMEVRDQRAGPNRTPNTLLHYVIGHDPP